MCRSIIGGPPIHQHTMIQETHTRLTRDLFHPAAFLIKLVLGYCVTLTSSPALIEIARPSIQPVSAE